MVPIGHGVIGVRVVGLVPKARGGVVKSVGVVVLGEGNKVALYWRWGIEDTVGEGR